LSENEIKKNVSPDLFEISFPQVKIFWLFSNDEQFFHHILTIPRNQQYHKNKKCDIDGQQVHSMEVPVPNQECE
jgi:hypothetical protein